jgi:hypothetical protein
MELRRVKIRGGHPMFKPSIALGVVLAILAAGATAKTLKVAKAEVAQHRAADVVQHRSP